MSTPERDQEPSRLPPRQPTSGGGGEGRRSGFVGRVQNMLGEVVAEIRKVTWPTVPEARNLTIVVIGISVLVGGLLGLVDLTLTGLIQLLTTGSVSP